MENKHSKRPPIGLIPIQYTELGTNLVSRYYDVYSAIARYLDAGLKINPNWIAEYNWFIDFGLEIKNNSKMDKIEIKEVETYEIDLDKVNETIQYFTEKRDEILDSLNDAVEQETAIEIIQTRFNSLVRVVKQLALLKDSQIIYNEVKDAKN